MSVLPPSVPHAAGNRREQAFCAKNRSSRKPFGAVPSRGGSNPPLSVPLAPVPVTGGHDGTAGRPVDGPRRQDDGGISTRLMEWTMPLLARRSTFRTFALLT